MRARPVSPRLLVTDLVERITAWPATERVRVAVDGPPCAGPDDLAEAVAAELPVLGRPALVVRVQDFLRPASLRFELGRTNPDAYYERWFDLDAVRREVLDPAGTAGTGRVLPTLWNPETDRATRAGYLTLVPGGVLLLAGPLLLGAGLPFELTVHLAVSPAALARRTPEPERWTLPAYRRYAEEAYPYLSADVVVRMDDPRHPALVEAR
ncbi:MAG TPA: uridine kinase [Micromonosporaceae bacterium]